MFKNYDTIICPDNIKKQILEQISNEKKIINLKFYTLNEFKKEVQYELSKYIDEITKINPNLIKSSRIKKLELIFINI